MGSKYEGLLSTLNGHTNGINAVTVSPDGQLLASGSFDDEVKLWDAVTSDVRGILDDFEENVKSGLPLNQQLAVSGLDEKTDSLDYNLTSVTSKELKGHSSKMICVVFSPDGQSITTGSHDTMIEL